jgi:8-oxo-dGTP pyrophosphatase MutT (NUDIX family)
MTFLIKGIDMLILQPSECQIAEKNTVTLMVMSKSGHLLILQRNPNAYENYIDPFPLYWELVGGHVEDGEEPEMAARRELAEETGISDVHVVLVGIAPFTHHGEPANNWIYIARVEENMLVNLSKEHVDYAWQSVAEVLQMQLAYAHSSLLNAVINTGCIENNT